MLEDADRNVIAEIKALVRVFRVCLLLGKR